MFTMAMSRASVWRSVRRSACGLAMIALAAAPALGADYTWTSATTGGQWSGTTNWTPNSPAGGPQPADTATLNTTASGTTRSVTIPSGASSGVTTLTITQTNSGTNELVISKGGFTVTNPLSLGASNGGVTRFYVSPPSTGATTVTFTNGVTLNGGGVLSLGHVNPSGTNAAFGSTVAGNVSIGGGSLIAEQYVKSGSATTTNFVSQITGSLSMTSGTVQIVNVSGTSDRRLTVTQGLAITGGAVNASVAGAGIQWYGLESGTFSPTSMTSDNITLTLYGSGDQSLTFNQPLKLFLRAYGTKTLSGGTFKSMDLADGGTTAGQGTTLKLGSNLAVASGGSLPGSTSTGASVDASSRIDLGIDAQTYTLDLSTVSGTFTPNSSFNFGTGTTTYWTFSGSGGRIAANAFNFNTGTAGGGTTAVATSVGPGLVLEARGGNGSVNNLSLGSGTGAIDASSVFRYAGSAAFATPATLTSTRSIGDLEVTSGVLSVLSLAGQRNIRVNGGTLLVSGTSFNGGIAPVSSGSFSVANGATLAVGNSVADAAVQGALASGTFAAGGLFGFETSAGNRAYGNAVNGSMGIAKLGANTLTLSASSGYTGGTQVNAGTMNYGDVNALGSGAVSFTSNATLQAGVSGTLANAIAGAATMTFDTQANNTVLTGVIGGAGNLVKTGAGTLTAAATNDFTGSIQVGGGTLELQNGFSGTNNYIGVASTANTNATLNISGGTTILNGQYGFAVSSGAGTQTGTVNQTGGVVSITGTNTYGISLGYSANSTGVYNLQSGTLQAYANGAIGLQVAGQNAASGTFTMTGGKLAMTTASGGLNGDAVLQIGRYDNAAIHNNTALFSQSGGVANVGVLSMGGATTTGTAGTIFSGTGGTHSVVLTGGTFTANRFDRLAEGSGNVDTIRIGGSADVTLPAFPTVRGAGATATVYFNGGVLRPSAASATYMGGLTNAFIQAGGATLDVPTGSDITISQALLADGTSAGGGLTKSGAGTLTLAGANSYTGATTVSGGTLALGASNVLPSSSAVSLAGGALAVGGYTNTIGSLATSGNATINISITGGSAGSLTTGDLNFGGGTNTLALSLTSATAGIYNVLTYTGNKTGSFTATGAGPNYTVLNGSGSNGVIAVQRKADLGTVLATAANTTIITGGSTAISYTVANLTPTGGAALAFASSSGANVAGTSNGTAGANATSGTVSGLYFTGTGIGFSQAAAFTVQDPNAITTTGTGNVSVTVLDHATSSLAATLLTGTSISLGTYNYATNSWESGNGTGLFSIYNIQSAYGANLTAALSLDGVSGGGLGYSTTLASYANIAGGTSAQYAVNFDPTTAGLSLASGTQSATFLLAMWDQTGLQGGLASNTLSVTATVVMVPEPGALALAGMGAAVVIWTGLRRRRSTAC